VFWVTTIRNFIHSSSFIADAVNLNVTNGLDSRRASDSSASVSTQVPPPTNHYRKQQLQQLSYQISRAFVKYNLHSSYTGLQPYCTVHRHFTEPTGLLSLNRHSRTGWAQPRDLFWDLGQVFIIFLGEISLC